MGRGLAGYQVSTRYRERSAQPLEGLRCSARTLTPVQLKPEDRLRGKRGFQSLGAVRLTRYEGSLDVSAFSSKFDAFLAGQVHVDCRRDGRLPAVRRQRQLQLMPRRRKRDHSRPPGQTDTSKAAAVNPLFTCFGSANEGLPLNPRDAFYLSDHAGFLRVHRQSLRLRLQRSGMGTFLRSGFGSAPNPNSDLDTVCTECRRPDAGVYGAQRGHDTATVSHHRGARALLPEGVLPQWLHQEPEAARTLLQHARQRLSFDVTSGHCPAGTTEKVDCWPMPEVPNNLDMTTGNLGLTDQEERPDRRVPADAHGRLHDTLPRQRYLYGHLHDRAVRLDPQGNEFSSHSAASALRIGNLRRCACPSPHPIPCKPLNGR